MPDYTQAQLEQELKKREEWLRARPGWVGHGVGMGMGGGLAVKVFVNGMSKTAREEVEEKFSGVPVVIEDHGPVRPQGG